MRVLGSGVVLFLLTLTLPAQSEVQPPGDLQRVLLIDGAQQVQMRDIIASRKGRWSVVVSKHYYVFKGSKAGLRTRTALPVFQFDADAAFEGPVYLFRLDARSDRREIRVAQGYSGLAEMSIPKDRLVETSLEEIGSGENSAKRYRLKPLAALRPGEYCLSRRISVCYDFGVD